MSSIKAVSEIMLQPCMTFRGEQWGKALEGSSVWNKCRSDCVKCQHMIPHSVNTIVWHSLSLLNTEKYLVLSFFQRIIPRKQTPHSLCSPAEIMYRFSFYLLFCQLSVENVLWFVTIFFYITNLARSFLQCLCLHFPLKNHVILLHVIHIPFHVFPFPVSLILFPFLVIFQYLRIKNWGKGITSLVTRVWYPEPTQRQMEKTNYTRLSSQTEIRCPQKM